MFQKRRTTEIQEIKKPQTFPVHAINAYRQEWR